MLEISEPVSRAEHLLLVALRSIGTPPGPCPCLFRLYGDHFKRDGGTLLGSIFAAERLLRLMPHYEIEIGAIDAPVRTPDEVAILHCLACTQSKDQMQQYYHFKRHFNVMLPRMLSDLFEDIAYVFEHHDMQFSSMPVSTTAPTVELANETIH